MEFLLLCNFSEHARRHASAVVAIDIINFNEQRPLSAFEFKQIYRFGLSIVL